MRELLGGGGKACSSAARVNVVEVPGFGRVDDGHGIAVPGDTESVAVGTVVPDHPDVAAPGDAFATPLGEEFVVAVDELAGLGGRVPREFPDVPGLFDCSL